MTIPPAHRATVPYLYRYANVSTPERLDWLRIILLNHELYFPSLPQLNDPADGRPKLAAMPGYKFAAYLFDDFLRRNPNAPLAVRAREEAVLYYNVLRHGVNRLQRLFSKGLNEELKDYRIYSLSKRYDNMSMWAKYGESHTGYCLEFANEGPLFEHAMEVTYKEAVPMDVTNPDQRKGYFFFFKKPDWSNEEEVRLVLPRNKGSKVKIDPHWLTRIILGKNMFEENRSIIQKWAEERQPRLEVTTAYYDEPEQVLRLRSL
jgi:Protein of unknown function (DUF2971)